MNAGAIIWKARDGWHTRLSTNRAMLECGPFQLKSAVISATETLAKLLDWQFEEWRRPGLRKFNGPQKAFLFHKE